MDKEKPCIKKNLIIIYGILIKKNKSLYMERIS